MESVAKPTMVLTARGRRVVLTLTLLPLLVLMMTLFINSGGFETSATANVDSNQEVLFETVTVGHGDTLWGIAQTIAPDQDPRDVIAELKKLNALTISTVNPGQQLAIPLKYSS